jgi:uncharacterized RDD family membrane protein YckC
MTGWARFADIAGAVLRFVLGVAVAVGVFFAARAVDLHAAIAVVLGLIALYVYGSTSTNGYLPGTRRWKARRATRSH